MNNVETNKDNLEDFFNFGAPKEKPKAPQMAPLKVPPNFEKAARTAGRQ